ncbi:MAG: SRPBCC family protein, partial [Actinobacteria bacterium]|nr:SRPBCC family protein [Actinomycetota bacterium]
MTEPAEEKTSLRVADQPSTSVTRLVGRPAEEIWALISDIEFPAAHSQEFLGAEWLDGASGPALGARFLGRNRNEHFG